MEDGVLSSLAEKAGGQTNLYIGRKTKKLGERRVVIVEEDRKRNILRASAEKTARWERTRPGPEGGKEKKRVHKLIRPLKGGNASKRAGEKGGWK